ncbi:MAG: hypothetical protein JWP61_965 [Friedmanniella sp.]|nr:hypothetical protein [Friedmanniella sp.]
MPSAFPQGRYLSATGVARPNSGGQTRAMLMRSRLITAATGRPVDVLCFDPSRGYDQVRAAWRRSGLLTEDMQLLNIFEHYRTAGWGDDRGSSEGLAELHGLEAVDKPHPDGSPWSTSYLDPASGRVVVNDYRRADNSVYLRAAPYRTTSPEALPRELIRVSPDGEICGRYTSLTPWYHRWIRELTAEDEQTFLFMDSRYLVPIIAPLTDPAVHLIYVLHNCHLPAPRLWNTPPAPDYQRCLERIADVDAFVTLTQRQREDIELRWGPRTNLAVVPNPVELPTPPTPPRPRDPHRVILIARLERQKRIQDAIQAMRLVVAELPSARLDVYGSGKRQPQLQALIEQTGLSNSVILHGHDPTARDELWAASAFLLTSEFEGYPLATLESLSRGCPVVAYDIKYGPKEQIREGVDGYVVADGDRAAAAARVLRLLRSPALVQTMGEAGRVTAQQHGPDSFLQNWAQVLASVVERSPRRTRLDAVWADVTVRPAGRWSLTRPASPRLVVAGLIHGVSAGGLADPGDAVVTLDVVDDSRVEIASVPVRAVRRGPDLRFTAAVHLDEVRQAMPESRRPALRLRLTWENSAWESLVRTNRALSDRMVAPTQAGEVLRLRHPSPRTRWILDGRSAVRSVRRRAGDWRRRRLAHRPPR